MARRPDVGHDVDVPDPLPALIWRLGPAADAYPGVGAEEFDGPVLGLHGLDQMLDVGFLGDVGLESDPAHFGRRCLYDRVDLDAWLDDYKQQGRAGKESKWPVKPGSTDVAIPATGGLQQRYRTASAYAKVLALETEVKPKPFLPS